MSENNPFGNLPLFGDIARLLSSQGPVNWDVATQLATWVATEGEHEPNVEPVERIRFEELLRVAELRVADASGLSTSPTGGLLQVVPVTRSDWASRSLSAYRPFLERLATALTSDDDADGPDLLRGSETSDSEHGPDAAALLGDLGKMLSPVLLGVQAGSMVGHLARRCLGQYDLPLPRPPGHDLLAVPANLESLTNEWSLPVDDLRLWVCIREVALHSVLGRPHVDARLRHLLDQYVGGFRFDPGSLETGLGGFNPSDPAGLSALFGEPGALLGLVASPGQQQILEQIAILVIPVVGYVDHLLDSIGTGLIGSYGQLSEALRRRRVEESDGDRFVGQMLGLTLGRKQYDRAHIFIKGVLDRAGEEGLGRLWGSEEDLPTAAELDAPGLWLARIDL